MHKVMMKIIRSIYIVCAIVFVCYGYYTTILLANEKTLLVKDEVKVYKKFLYPSVSFCYKFKVPVRDKHSDTNQEKNVWMLYYRHHVERWKNSGCVLKGIQDSYAADIKTYNNSDIAECSRLCNEEPECDQWTQIYGVCYLKTEDSFKHFRQDPDKKWISGIRNCNLNDSSCIFEDFDYFGGDILTAKSNSAEECSRKCDATKNCKKFTYYTDTACDKCHLKKLNLAFHKEKCEGCTTGFGNSSLQQCGNEETLDDLSLFLDQYKYQTTDFLFSLQQRFNEGETEKEMLNQTNLWTFSIPHEESGPCYTYNPPTLSDPGYPNSLFIVLNFEDWTKDLDVFLHEKGKLFFQDSWTSDTIRLDKNKLENIATGHPRVKVLITKVEDISSEDEPCNDEPDYNYYECFESFFYQKRKCQYPWNVYPNLNVSVCNSFEDTERMLLDKDRNFGYNRYDFDHSERMTRTKNQCPRPCKYTEFNLKYRPWDVSTEKGGFRYKSIQIGFSNFRTVYRKQYYSCDMFCVLGQLGGNLGFFLGGSILAGIDLIISAVAILLQIAERKETKKNNSM